MAKKYSEMWRQVFLAALTGLSGNPDSTPRDNVRFAMRTANDACELLGLHGVDLPMLEREAWARAEMCDKG